MEKRTGGCHCKIVRYEATLDLSKPAIECNCSHCQIKGALWSFIPATDFHITSGEANLTEYRFNHRKLAHLFCKTCGVQSFAKGEHDGVGTCAINVRTIDDIDLAAVMRTPVDGKSFE